MDGGAKFSELACPDLIYIAFDYAVRKTNLLILGSEREGNLFNNVVNYEIWSKNKAENQLNVKNYIVWCQITKLDETFPLFVPT